MTNDVFIGIAILLIVLGISVFLVFYCRFIINRIAEKKITLLRDIIKELFGGKSA